MRKAIAVCQILVGCGGAAEVAATPDLRELQASYDHPTAALDPKGADDVRSDLRSIDLLAAGLRAVDYVDESFDRASESAGGLSAQRIKIQGSVRVTRNCPGVRPRNDGPSGSLSLLLGIADSSIKRGMSGVFSQCVLSASHLGVRVRVDIDGPAEFDLGRDLPLGTRFPGRLLAVLMGSITVDRVVFRNVSARWTSERFEYLHELADGTTVVIELTKQGLSIRDRYVVWVCPPSSVCGLG